MILDMQVQEDLETPTDDTEVINRRDKTMIWKLKAQAARTSYRLFMRYARGAEYASNSEEDKAWCQLFIDNYSEMLCESHLQLVFKKKTHFVGSKTLNFSLKLVSCATKVSKTMTKMLPFVETILYDSVILLMLATKKDQELFTDDPVEYIRKQIDVFSTIYQPKQTSSELL